jgi:hypothetical protein
MASKNPQNGVRLKKKTFIYEEKLSNNHPSEEELRA